MSADFYAGAVAPAWGSYDRCGGGHPHRVGGGGDSTRKLSSCPFCGRSCRRVHDRRRREIRDLEISGRPTVLLWTQRRFVCNHCGKRYMETHPQFEGGLTRRLARRLVQDAQVMPISAVSRRQRVGWHLVMGLVSDIGPKTRPPMLLRPTIRFPLRRIEPDHSLGGITKSRHPASTGIATLLDSRVATQPEVFSWCTRTTDPADSDRYTAARSGRSLAASTKTGSTSHPIRRSLQCFTVDPKLSNTRIFIAASISRSPGQHAGSK